MSLFNKISLLALLASSVTALSAVTVDSKGVHNKAIFGIEFPEAGRSFLAQENTVMSISLQQYITGNYNVIELNIVTSSSALTRIYHSRTVKPAEIQAALADGAAAAGAPSSIIQKPLPPQIQKLADRAAGAQEAMTSSTVIKDYPIATHAHTVEYRLSSRQELLDLHDELKKHWLKEPAFFEAGQIVDEEDAVDSEMKPRSLGGTLFIIEN
ncbi:MAG: hypothetical protein NWT02_12290 [Opitutales bacterium]|jgi:alpha-galactosidase/6-phospho-beta-glucosidase family protein|nr:hypothetical protein [Opitutales bacterium]MDP4644048.1 hypothetical protein [Opitutales bacterium]